jgi:hypothetical protein
MENLPTQCKALDSLTDGGLPTGTISQVFGEKALGKSIFCFQAACAVVAAGRSAIVFDTEQSYFSYLVKYRLPGMNKRFGKEIPVREAKLEKVPKPSGKRKAASRSDLITIISDTLGRAGVAYSESQISSVGDILSPEFDVKIEAPDEPSVLIVQMPDIMQLLKLHGTDAEIHVSEKSQNPRVELRLKSTPVYESALYKMVEQTKAKLLIYDSLSAPLKATFPNTQDLPARSSSMAIMLSHAQRLCIQFDLAVLTTSHVSISPIEEWDRKPYGGIILGHDAKFSFELTKGTATRNTKGITELINPDDKPGDEKQAAIGRLIWAQRHPAMADYSKYGYASLDEEGFH